MEDKIDKEKENERKTENIMIGNSAKSPEPHSPPTPSEEAVNHPRFHSPSTALDTGTLWLVISDLQSSQPPILPRCQL